MSETKNILTPLKPETKKHRAALKKVRDEHKREIEELQGLTKETLAGYRAHVAKLVNRNQELEEEKERADKSLASTEEALAHALVRNIEVDVLLHAAHKRLVEE